MKCPTDGGMIVERKSRRGKVFYGCDQYPDCDFVLWYHPVDRECPQCDVKVLVEKTTKRYGTVRKCPQEECDYQITLIEPEKKPATKKAPAKKTTKKAAPKKAATKKTTKKES